MPRWPQRPDPSPLVTRSYLELTLRLDRGKPSMFAARRGSFARAQAILPRFTGRYAVELYSGKELLDVVRFDFPLAAAVGDPERASMLPLAAGVQAEMNIVVPYDDRITSAQLRDTKTQTSYPLDLQQDRAPAAVQPAPRPLRLGAFRSPDPPAAEPEPEPKPAPKRAKRSSRQPR